MDDLKSHRIDAILRHALEDLATWQPPTHNKSIGPAFPEVYPTFSSSLEKLYAYIRQSLSYESIHTLERDFPESRSAKRNLLFDRDGRRGNLAATLAKLKAKVPQDFIGGWSIKGKEIDTQHWRVLQTYTLAEATLLSVGLDPRKVDYDALFKTYGRYVEADELLYFLEDQYESIANGLGANPEIQTVAIDADRFFDWVNTYSFRIDERFRRMLNERRKSLSLTKASPDILTAKTAEKPLHRSSRGVHARMITAMAVSKYGLKRENQIGGIAKAIHNDGDLTGLSFDIKALRLLLRAGFQAYEAQNSGF